MTRFHPGAEVMRCQVYQYKFGGLAQHGVWDAMRTRTPVRRATVSLRDFRCCTLTVDRTLMPATSNTSTSCQRF